MAKILFIEDEATLQKMLSSALRDAGHEVLNAYDGEVGLRMAQTEKPDLVLLDLILPKKDGFSVLEEMKKVEATASIRTIVLTNLESAENVEKVVALGATTYLVKANYDLPDIVAKIKEVLSQ